MKKATMTAHISTFLLGIYLGMELLSPRIYLFNLVEPDKVFQSGCSDLIHHEQCVESSSLHP
jgi:hypothetical protein